MSEPDSGHPRIAEPRIGALAAAETAAIRRAVRATAAHDGVEPLSEQFLLALDGTDPRTTHVLAWGPTPDGIGVLGYAQAHPTPEGPAGELFVAPHARRRGLGRRLLSALPVGVRVWAHGPVPGAAEFAEAVGCVAVRGLDLMRRPATPPPPVVPPVPEFTVRTFVPGLDEGAWLAANAAAFAGHPEQGALTLADLRDRQAQPWFDPAGLSPDHPLDESLDDPAHPGNPPIAAFHWTKRPPGDPVGEVYAVGVVPAYQGRGLGRWITAIGVDHLIAAGVEAIELYVESDNLPAQRTYAALGFRVVATHVMYAGVMYAGANSGSIGP